MNRGESFQRELLSIALELDAKLYGKFPKNKSVFSQPAETLWTLLGVLLGLLIRAAPARWANFASQAMASSRAAEKSADPGAHLIAAPRDAVLIVTSHPENTPQESHLLGEMILQALRISEKISPGRRFQLVQAVDDFALDMLPLPVKGLYQGVMSQSHLAMDRMPGAKTPSVQKLLWGVHYSRTIFKILKALRNGETVCLALPGGVIHNSRALYVIREFARKIYREIPDHHKAGECRREFEISLIRLLSRGQDCAALTGILNPAQNYALSAHLEDRGISKEIIADLTADLKEELAFLTPYRERFFRVIIARLGSRGRPLLILPISHRNKMGQTGIFAGEPWRVNEPREGWEKDLKDFIRRSFPAG